MHSYVKEDFIVVLIYRLKESDVNETNGLLKRGYKDNRMGRKHLILIAKRFGYLQDILCLIFRLVSLTAKVKKGMAVLTIRS